MKSIRKQILISFLITVIISFSIVSLLLFNNLSGTLGPMIKEAVADVISQNSISLYEWLNGMRMETKVFSEDTKVTTMNWNFAKRNLNEQLDAREDRYNMFLLSNLKGEYNATDEQEGNIESYPFFQNITENNIDFAISNVTYDASSNSGVFYLGHAVRDIAGVLKGVFAVQIRTDVLTNKIESSKIGYGGISWLVDGEGNVIAYPDKSAILNENILNSTWYKDFNPVADKIISGETDYAVVTDVKGERTLIVYNPVPGTPNWAMIVSIPEKEILKNSNSITFFVIIILSIIVVVMVIVSYIVGNSISKPLSKLEADIEKFGNGDFTTEFKVKNKNEIGRIAASLNKMAANLKSTVALVVDVASSVEKASDILKNISEDQGTNLKKLTDQSEVIKSSTENTDTLVESVSAAVSEIASSAQVVSQSSAEISEDSEKSENLVHEGLGSVDKITKVINSAVEQSKNTIKTVSTLFENTKNISAILDKLNSITEQTNLLSLNAAIEAARAGEAGKGFAVVADEIRKLADESKKSTEEIGNILSEIVKDSKSADKDTRGTAEIIFDIKDESENISSNFTTISENIKDIAEKIENLTSIAEEQSASTEEMASSMENVGNSVNSVNRIAGEITEKVSVQNEYSEKLLDNSKKLYELSQKLHNVISNFKI
ncbi:MAG: methyl-accepting chemotaxis protein [Thermotogae bacterium]|nr:methyl-accepting chemotaxis protein [Thermotogota bacterium]